MSECALNAKKNNNNSCFTSDQVSLLTEYTSGNSIAEIKQETNCNNDKCILDKVNIPEKIKDKLIRETFKAPTGSYDHNYWLNNTEIDTVMSQFRHKYPGFAHGFIHMIDLKAFNPANIKTFDYSVFSVTEVDFPNEINYGLIKRGLLSGTANYQSKLSTYNNVPFHSYGIICNTDSSKGSGQHWFALFISTDQKDPENTAKPWIRIELFNSAGDGVSNKDFNEFWTKTAMNISKLTGLLCTFDIITTIQHQSTETGNCGAYSLFYIYSRLNGVHPSEFNNPHKPIRDYSMKKFREVCFKIDNDTIF